MGLLSLSMMTTMTMSPLFVVMVGDFKVNTSDCTHPKRSLLAPLNCFCCCCHRGSCGRMFPSEVDSQKKKKTSTCIHMSHVENDAEMSPIVVVIPDAEDDVGAGVVVVLAIISPVVRKDQQF